MEKEVKEEGLDNFSWEGGDVEIFGESGKPDSVMVDEKTTKKKVEAKEKKDDSKTEDKKTEELENDKKTEEDEKKTEDTSFFGVKSEEEEEEDSETKSKDDKKSKDDQKKTEEPKETEEETEEKSITFFTDLSNELKESGVFANVEIKKDAKIDEDGFFELHAQEVEARVDETFEAFFEELDDDAKKFLKFKKNGGDTAKFFGAVRQKLSRPKGEISDKAYQQKILRHYYATIDKMDAEEIEDRIEWLDDAGKTESFAKKYEKKLDDADTEIEQLLIKEQEDAAEEKIKTKDKFNTAMKKALDKSDEIHGFPITKKDKLSLLNYVTKYDVKVGKNSYVTKFQKDLQSALNNDAKLLLVAKLIMTDFDISDLETKAETKTVRKIKSNLERSKKETKKPVGTGSSGVKTLSEYF